MASWNELVNRKDDYGMGSCPNNPDCKTSTPSCSRTMRSGSELCFWHSYRIGEIREYNCGCPGKKWLTANGDSIGRNLVYQTNPGKEFCCLDFACILWCCSSAQNRDTDIYTCGEMRVCEGCSSKHTNLIKISREEDDDFSEDSIQIESSTTSPSSNSWEHLRKYRDAITIRMIENKTWKYSIPTQNGPLFRIPDSIIGSLTVNSASTALVAAGRNPSESEWWIWVAGWYNDCPIGIMRHI